MWQTDFPLLQQTKVHWLDNAATTQKPASVIKAMNDFYLQNYANVHRGIYSLAEEATKQYEGVRDQVQQWLNAKSREEIIFTSGTTASLNIIANQLAKLVIKPGEAILLSPFEHHSNLVPWQMVAKQLGAKIIFFDTTADDQIDLSTVEQKLKQKVKIVALAHITNAVGTIQPVETIIKLAHKFAIPVVIDAAQSAAHLKIDVQQMDCDFLALSAHKMCGPNGIGILYGKRQWLEKMEPLFGGGDMIRSVSLTKATWNDLPYKFEAGTPNIVGVIGLGAALDYLKKIDQTKRVTQINKLYNYLLDELVSRSYIKIFGPTDRTKRNSIVSFYVKNVHPHDVAQILDTYNVAIRAGHHCAQPVMERWQVPATVRASLFFYNTLDDVEALLKGLDAVYNKFNLLS